MFINKIFLLIYLLDFKLLVSFRKFFIFVNNFVEFFLLFFDVRLYVRQFIICMLFNDPFQFWEDLIGFDSLHRRWMELLS